MGIFFPHPCTREATWRADCIWERPLEDMWAWEELAGTVCTTGQLCWELAGRQSAEWARSLVFPKLQSSHATFPYTPCPALVFTDYMCAHVHTHARACVSHAYLYIYIETSFLASVYLAFL